MQTIRSWVQRYPLGAFFALTFILSWGAILIVAAIVGFPGSTDHPLFPIALIANESGPLIAGLLLTALVFGRAGRRDLWARFRRWRVEIGWYAVALGAVPLLVLPTLLILARVSPIYLPNIFTTDDRTTLLLSGLMAGLLGGLFEEPGWTGFAVPELRRRHSVLTTGLIVGAWWGIWHIVVTLWASGDATGALSAALFLPPLCFYLLVLPVFRVLMVWVFDHTDSLLIVMLMHAVLTGGTIFVLAPAATGASLALYYVILAAVIGLAIAAIAAANGGHLSRHDKPPTTLDTPQLLPR